MTENKIYAIIITFNGETLIRQCLNSLRHSSIPVNIVVVDNASEDETLNIVELDFPEVVIFRCSKNNGFGHANNIGIKYAHENQAKYVLLLNQDAWVESDTISKLLSAGEQAPEYYVLSPVHLNKQGTGFDRGFMQYVLPPFCESFFFSMFTSSPKKLYSTTFVNAAAWLVSREAISTIGFFDPLFYHYGEDKDYCNRILFHKKKIGIVSDSIVYHSRETTCGKMKSVSQTLKKEINNNYFLSLIELKRLDNPFLKLGIIYSTGLFLTSLKNILRFRFYRSFIELLTFGKFITDIHIIVSHRKECLKVGETFLNKIKQDS